MKRKQKSDRNSVRFCYSFDKRCERNRITVRRRKTNKKLK